MKAVSKTAYYCCGVRMQDAESAHPVVNDTYARRLMGEEGLKYWEEFKNFKMPNAGNTARAYIIDNFLKEELLINPNSTVIIIGAGLDSRAYRLNGGIWIEIDEQAVIDYKNEILTESECKNKLVRIPINFETEKLSDKLYAYSGNKHILIVVEGVLMYLTNDQRNVLLQTVSNLFPKHTLYCDLMSKKFFEKLGTPIHKKFSEYGATFKDLNTNPADLFLQYGYKQTDQVSMIQKAQELGLAKTPKFLMKLLLGKLIMGYSTHRFIHE